MELSLKKKKEVDTDVIIYTAGMSAPDYGTLSGGGRVTSSGIKCDILDDDGYTYVYFNLIPMASRKKDSQVLKVTVINNGVLGSSFYSRPLYIRANKNNGSGTNPEVSTVSAGVSVDTEQSKIITGLDSYGDYPYFDVWFYEMGKSSRTVEYYVTDIRWTDES